MSFEIVAPSNRTTQFSGKLYEADGVTAVLLDSTDKLRFKMGRGNAATPVIDIKSGTPTANSTSITITTFGSGTTPAAYTLSIAQGDLLALYGPYDAEIIVIDDSATQPNDAALLVETGTVWVIGTLGGNLGL